MMVMLMVMTMMIMMVMMVVMMMVMMMATLKMEPVWQGLFSSLISAQDLLDTYPSHDFFLSIFNVMIHITILVTDQLILVIVAE